MTDWAKRLAKLAQMLDVDGNPPGGVGSGSITVSDDHGTSVTDVTELQFAVGYVVDMGSGIALLAPYQPLVYPTTLTFVSNAFDGLFNLLGVNAGGGTFVNPHGTYYTATQSSNQDGTRLAPLATDHGNDANTGSTHTQNSANQWWKADFGAGQNVTPTRLAILGRSGGGTHIGAFKLQGSNDNSAWTDLLTVATPGVSDNTWGSWAVSGSAAYRYLRILQTASNYLTLGDVEIWGTIDD